MTAIVAASHDLPGEGWSVLFEGDGLGGRIAFLIADATTAGASARFVIGRLDGVLELYDCGTRRTTRHANLPALLAEVWRRLSGSQAGRLGRIGQALRSAISSRFAGQEAPWGVANADGPGGPRLASAG